MKRTLLGRLRGYLLAGILVTAPIGITLYLTWLIIDLIDSQVMPLIPARYHPETYLPFSVPGLGVLVALVFLIFVGWVTAGLAGRWMIRLSEHLLAAMPIVRNVYSAIKQIMETVLAQKSNAFREVVLLEYPRRGMWVIGFITSTTEGEVRRVFDAEMANVFIPTTPNPTSGFLLFVPRSDLVVLKMSVEDGIKLVVSGGIVSPPDPRSGEQDVQPVVRLAENAS